MNQLTKFLVDGILNEGEQKTLAAYGGGFKPPTSGHFEVVKQALKDNPEIDEFIIYVGSGTRNGISQAESVLIWEIYQTYLPMKVKIEPSKAPIGDVLRLGKNNPQDKVYFVIGAREGNEGDLEDIKNRTRAIGGKHPNMEVKVITTKNEGMSGTNARKAAKVSFEDFAKFLPTELSNDEKETVYNIVKPVIKESLNENASYSQDIDIKQRIMQLTQHMLDKGMNIEPLPNVEFVDGDNVNAREFLGKTAYYDPNSATIVLYTEGRHPKDIVRSFSHEMIHHIQNLEGRLGNITTTNTQEDDALNDIEAEANLKGTMTFRNWTDSLNEGLEDVSLDYIKTKLPKLDSYPKSDIILSKGDFIYINIPQDKDFGMTAEIKAFDKKDGTLVAQSSFDYDKNGKLKGTLDVRPDKRRLGIATEIYKLSEKIIGDTIFPEEKHTEDAKKFWQQKNRSFGPKTDDNLNENILPQEKFAQEKNQDYVEQALKILPNKDEYNLKDYTVEILPIDKVKPTQFGEDYINASSEYEAEQYQKYIDGEIEAEDLRREDFYPIVVDKDTMEILDGNHRHAVHTMLSIPKIKAILVSKKLNEANKPYKHKHGFDDKLGKDPFGINAYARELASGLEEEIEEGRKKKKDPKKGTGKKPKDSSRRLYTDEDPKDTIGIKFRTKEDIVDTLNKKSFKAKSHARQSQIINLIHQRVRAAYNNAKDPDTKSRLKRGLDYITKRKESSKKKTQRLKNQKNENVAPNHDGKAAPYGSGYDEVKEGDTYEKMAAKGKKAGSLKQGTVRKRLGIKKGDKIPLSLINKEIARLKKMDKDPDKKGAQLGDKNQKYYKALQLSKTLKTTTNVNEDAGMIKCSNCGWEWELSNGGDDPYLCHKCGHDNKPNLMEGRYDTITNKLSKIIFEAFKDIHDRGEDKGKISLTIGPDDEDIISNEFEFDLEATVEFVDDDQYEVDGGANVGFDDEGDEVTPLLSVRFKIPKNPKWNIISFDIKDVVRHELEHLTQEGGNLKSDKFMKDDQILRNLIDMELLSKAEYFKLEKEVDAMLQGMYFKAKKSKTPFEKVLNDYLDIFVDQKSISKEEKDDVLNIWRSRRKSLSLPPFE